MKSLDTIATSFSEPITIVSNNAGKVIHNRLIEIEIEIDLAIATTISYLSRITNNNKGQIYNYSTIYKISGLIHH